MISHVRFTLSTLICALAICGTAFCQGGSGSTHVFYVNSSGHVGQLYRYISNSSYAWASQDVTAAAGAPSVGAGSGLSALVGMAEHVFYVDSSQHVQHLVNDENDTSWTSQDLMALTGCPLAAAGSPVAAVNPLWANLYVAYVTTKLGLNVLLWNGSSWSCKGGGWGPEAGGTIAGYANDLPHFFYAHLGYLWELHTECNPSCEYVLQDFGLPASGSAGIATFADYRGLHVYYQDLSQHIHENLCASENGSGICSGWVDTDLTANYGGGTLPAASSRLTGYYDADTGNAFPYSGEHVYYVATSGDVNLLLKPNNGNINEGNWFNTDVIAASGFSVPADPGGGLASAEVPEAILASDDAFFLESGSYQVYTVFLYAMAPQFKYWDVALGIEGGPSSFPAPSPHSPMVAFVVQ